MFLYEPNYSVLRVRNISLNIQKRGTIPPSDLRINYICKKRRRVVVLWRRLTCLKWASARARQSQHPEKGFCESNPTRANTHTHTTHTTDRCGPLSAKPAESGATRRRLMRANRHFTARAHAQIDNILMSVVFLSPGRLTPVPYICAKGVARA